MIGDATTRAILIAYGVPGVDAAALRAHLDDMVMLVGLTGGRPVISGPQVVSVEG
jgi:DNA/RNA-binding domain of Phe-tRNA-synthetase-like protein